MEKAVRVSASGSWAYMPMGGQAGRLLSESGPVFPRNDVNNSPDASHVFSMTNGISIEGGKLVFGHADGCMSYNGFLDVSLVADNGGKPTGLSEGEPADGDIVLAACEGKVLPARLSMDGHRMSISLPTNLKAGERCFVTSEDGKLISVSYASQGTDTTRIAPRLALVSWLHHVDPKMAQSRYDVQDGGDGFVVTDKSSGKSYTGRLRGGRNEMAIVSHLVGMHGLGGIIPNYTIRILKGGVDGKDNGKQDGILERR